MAKAQNIYPRGGSAKLTHPCSLLAFDSNDHVEGTAGAASAKTYAADADGKTVVGYLHCSYDATPAAGAYVQIADGSTVVWKQFLSAAGPYEFNFPQPKAGSVNTALIVTLSAPGGSIHGSLDIGAWRETTGG